MVKGCSYPARFFMKRVMRDGKIQRGLVCEGCERRYGQENLARAAKESGSIVIMLSDAEGSFEGILNRV
jgi:hypothetical protein